MLVALLALAAPAAAQPKPKPPKEVYYKVGLHPGLKSLPAASCCHLIYSVLYEVRRPAPSHACCASASAGGIN